MGGVKEEVEDWFGEGAAGETESAEKEGREGEDRVVLLCGGELGAKADVEVLGAGEEEVLQAFEGVETVRGRRPVLLADLELPNVGESVPRLGSVERRACSTEALQLELEGRRLGHDDAENLHPGRVVDVRKVEVDLGSDVTEARRILESREKVDRLLVASPGRLLSVIWRFEAVHARTWSRMRLDVEEEAQAATSEGEPSSVDEVGFLERVGGPEGGEVKDELHDLVGEGRGCSTKGGAATTRFGALDDEGRGIPSLRRGEEGGEGDESIVIRLV